MYRVILYYKFYTIEYPNQFCLKHKEKCQGLGLKGRVYIASEGINGTLAGESEAISQYKKYLSSINGFENTEFKEDIFSELPFQDLRVKTRPEIVSLKASVSVDPSRESGGKYLEPHQWRQILESGRAYTLLDVRNNYESAIGHFKGAITPDVENFFDFEKWLDQNRLDKNKKVLMYCTGGIRCEKFSVLMRKKGYQDVYQLQGGIINYAQKEKGAHFCGKCFVFDDRLAVTVNPDEQEPIARCEMTGVPCDQYLNCANIECNRLFICSPEAAIKGQGCCSEDCRRAKRLRPLDPNNIYAPSRRWHWYLSDKG